jgi:hypothetical protein
MNLGGKDYVFQKANGDAEWWEFEHRRKHFLRNVVKLRSGTHCYQLRILSALGRKQKKIWRKNLCRSMDVIVFVCLISVWKTDCQILGVYNLYFRSSVWDTKGRGRWYSLNSPVLSSCWRRILRLLQPLKYCYSKCCFWCKLITWNISLGCAKRFAPPPPDFLSNLIGMILYSLKILCYEFPNTWRNLLGRCLIVLPGAHTPSNINRII